MPDLSIKLYPEEIRSIAFGAIGAAYARVGTPFENASRLVKFHNFTNANLLISFDGVTDHDAIFATSSHVMDLMTNHSAQAGEAFFPIGTQIWVKQETGAPGSGNFYVVTYYGY
jgi:hypothetical protein